MKSSLLISGKRGFFMKTVRNWLELCAVLHGDDSIEIATSFIQGNISGEDVKNLLGEETLSFILSYR